MALINKEQEYQDQETWSDNVQKLKGYKEFKEKVDYYATQKDGYNDPIISGPYEILWDDKLGWCVDVDGYVSFSGLYITKIPFQFRNVNGFFSCSNCENLISLKGCPVYVNGSFYGTKYCNEFTKEYIRSLCNVKGDIYNGTNQ